MTSFENDLGDFLFNSDGEKRLDTTDQPTGLVDSVKQHDGSSRITSHGLLSGSDIEVIEQNLGHLDLDADGDKLDGVRSKLLGKTWFAFDLDDTLHEFRKASGIASLAVFEAITTKHGPATSKLQQSYKVILTRKTADAFTDGKTSTEYRKDRFAALFQEHDIEPVESELDDLAELHKKKLQQSLTIKPGVHDLFHHLKALGKRIAIITEGPEDAQDWTVRELGLGELIDALLTTNKLGMSKTDGMFKAALVHLQTTADRVVVIGDSVDRDIIPAMEEEIFTVHYSEMEDVRLDLDGLRIDSHFALRDLLNSNTNGP